MLARHRVVMKNIVIKNTKTGEEKKILFKTVA